MPSPIRIAVVDDHRVVADAICTILEITPGIEVVARIYDASKVVQSVRELRPDILLCDLEMPTGDPLESAVEALNFSPDTQIVILSAYPTDAHIRRAVTLHVRGFLTKNEPTEAIIEGIRAVARGREVYSDEVRERFRSQSQDPNQESKLVALSPRELHIVRLVAQGLTTPEIAKTAFRSEKTIQQQLYSAMKKTDTKNRVELARWAIREGIVQP